MAAGTCWYVSGMTEVRLVFLRVSMASCLIISGGVGVCRLIHAMSCVSPVWILVHVWMRDPFDLDSFAANWVASSGSSGSLSWNVSRW